MTTPREFAVQVVQKLQDAGYTALWAGGCVRDQLVGRAPKDYDVATNAVPEQIRELFGRRRTLAIGAAFGVITIVGPKSAGQIEVATFRRDGGYSDGRRPDAIEFTDAREDAVRRDFTINGMFFDPIANQVIDYVGGQDDLELRQVRAIGDPHARIEEDKLRMLRGVRFASTFGFELEEATLRAIQQHAAEIEVVSGERIGAEMRRMLAGEPAQAAVLLQQSGLLAEILPGGQSVYFDATKWQEKLEALERLSPKSFETSFVVLLDSYLLEHSLEKVVGCWKLSNEEKKSIGWIHKNWRTLSKADSLAWSAVQPLLIQSDAVSAISVAKSVLGKITDGIKLCEERLTWSPDALNPQPFLDGSDLMELGIARGPVFKRILNEVRNRQLDGTIGSIEQAKALAIQIGQSE